MYLKTSNKTIGQDYPYLLQFMKYCYAIPAIRSTTNIKHIKMHYCSSHPKIIYIYIYIWYHPQIEWSVSRIRYKIHVYIYQYNIHVDGRSIDPKDILFLSTWIQSMTDGRKKSNNGARSICILKVQKESNN